MVEAPTFKEWLVKSVGVSARSAKVYQSYLKSFGKLLDDNFSSGNEKEEFDFSPVSPELIQEALKKQPTARTPYRCYVRYMKEVHGKELPAGPDTPVGRPPKPAEDEHYEIPMEVVDALIVCVNAGLSIKMLKERTWGHIVWNETKKRYETPEANGSKAWIILPKEAIQALRDWAQPEEGRELYTPLVPVTPKGKKVANLKWLAPLIEVRMSNRGKS